MNTQLHWCAVSLWVSRLLSTLVSASPLTQFSPQSIDQDYFAPGGLMLLEVARLSRPSLAEALKLTSVFFVASQLLILFCQAALFHAAVTAPQGPHGAGRMFGMRLGAVMAFSGLSLLRLATSVAALAGIAFGLGPWFYRVYTDQGIGLALIGPLAVAVVLAFCMETMIAIGFDCARLGLFLPRQERPVRRILTVIRDRAASLFFARGLLLLWTLSHAVLTLLLMTCRWPVAATWLATLLMLGIAVLCQAVWLRRASTIIESCWYRGSHALLRAGTPPT